jgi:predicted ATPase
VAALADPGLVPQAVAVLGVREEPGRALTETLADFLRGKQLLVLDNCEHVVGACAQFVEGLLRACGEVR